MFELSKGGERAILVHVFLPKSYPQYRISESEVLIGAAGAEVLATVTARRHAPMPKFFIGSGKVDEIRQQVVALAADLVVFNHELSPLQERNLEKALCCRVIDRTRLILDIFAQRARSFEGKLQVELAQLEHMSTRLVRGWTHLERQKGGIGLRGPGETQLETDRRLLANRVKSIKRRLKKVSSQRQLMRQSRQKAGRPTVALVGYTNAGKSTLFNRLTSADVLVADQLFATLDPTLRRMKTTYKKPILMADTVGFIQHLPHSLVEAFHATLEETRDADLLLHVVDVTDEHCGDNIASVNDVLKDIAADKVPQFLVYNKVDQLPEGQRRTGTLQPAQTLPRKFWLSAATGEGVDSLCRAIEEYIYANEYTGPSE